MSSRYPRYSGFGYGGYVFIDDREEWIRDHSFASREWMRSNVKFRQWEYQRDGSFNIYIKEILPRKVLTILLRCRHYPSGGPHCPHPDYVQVFHSHIIDSKRR
jgi:hypothetical protein